MNRFRRDQATVATLEDVQVTSPRSGVSVVSFYGEHDLATSQSTAELLDSLLLANDLVIADVSDAQFIDASMLHVLIVADKAARARGADFRIRLGTTAIVQRTFQISGVLDQLTWASSMDEALGGSQAQAQQDASGGSSGARSAA
jgi:anti-anti-sigma factor